MLIRRLWLTAIALSVVMGSLTKTNAQPRIQLQEEVELDLGTKHPSHLAAQRGAVDKLEKFLSSPPESLTAPDFTQAEIMYLTGAYLICSLRKGTCKEILDGILTLDLLEASKKKSKDVQCTRMHQFWQIWLKNEMEKKHEYNIKTSFLKVRSEFNQLERPKYLRCSRTVAALLEDEEYQSIVGDALAKDGPVQAMTTILQEINKAVPNVNDPSNYR